MNEIQKIQVSTHGAELISLVANGREYLWNGDPKYWGRHAPILFPVVGKLADDTMRIDGKAYKMKQHGFARDAEFVRCPMRRQLLGGAYQLLEENEWKMMRFEMVSDDRANYPYHFELAVDFITQTNTLVCEWQVINRSDKDMHFQIGAHPAFMLPDYNETDEIHGYLQCYDAFGKVVSPIVFSYLEDGLRHAYGTPKTLVNDKAMIALTNNTFTNDAILLEEKQVTSVVLFDKQGKRILTVTCPQAEVFGIWAPNKQGCPFVCIEPWCGIADRYDFDGDITEREHDHSLVFDETYFFRYSIQIHE